MRTANQLGKWIQSAAAIAVVCFGLNASAAVWCGSQVTGVGVDGAGKVYFASTISNNGAVNACNINVQVGSITPGACKIWMAGLQAAVLSGRQIAVEFVGSTTSCTGIGSWTDLWNAPYQINRISF